MYKKFLNLNSLLFYLSITFVSTLIFFTFFSFINIGTNHFKGNSDLIGILIQCTVALLALVISINWVITQTISANISPHYLSHYIRDSDFIPFLIIGISIIILELVLYFGLAGNSSICVHTNTISKAILSSQEIFILSYSLGVSLLFIVIFYVVRTLKAFNITDILDSLEKKITDSTESELHENLTAYFDTLSSAIKNNNTLVIQDREKFLLEIIPVQVLPELLTDYEGSVLITKELIRMLESSSIIALNNNYESISLIFLNVYSEIGKRIINKNGSGLNDIILSLKRIGTRSIQCGFFWAPNKTADIIGDLGEQHLSTFIDEKNPPKESLDRNELILALGEIGTFSATRQIAGPCRHCVKSLTKAVDFSLSKSEKDLYHNAILTIIGIIELSIRNNCSIAGVFLDLLNEIIKSRRNDRIHLIYSLYGKEYPSSIRWIVDVISKIQYELNSMPHEGGFLQLINVYENLISGSNNESLKGEIEKLFDELNEKNKNNFSWPKDKYENVRAWLNFEKAEI